MAPNGTLPKRKPKENQFLFDLGVKGRHTGITIPDTGIRDENGLEPMDALFSSPAKPKGRPKKVYSAKKNANTTISSEEDMDVGESTIPEPELVLERRASVRMPPPRSKSPIKTFLQSPARRHHSIAPGSSPTRGSIVAPRSASVSASVRRKLDFSSLGDENSSETSVMVTKTAALPAAGRLTKTTHLQTLQQPLSSDNADREEAIEEAAENDDDTFQMVNGASEDDFQMVEPDNEEPEVEEDEPEPEEAVQPLKKGKRKSPQVDAPVEPAKKGRRGRPKKAEPAPVEVEAAIQDETLQDQPEEPEEEEPEEPEEPVEEQEEERPAKRTRRSLDKAPEVVNKRMGRPKKTIEPIETIKKAAGKSRQTGEASNASKPKAKAPKPELAPISEDSPEVKRGPPLPRNNRGLVILRRETPAEGIGFKQTRSGRNSIKPVAYWRNERVEYSEDENEDGRQKFLLPRIKEVVRTDEVDDRKPTRRGRTAKPTKGKKRAEPESEDEENAEPWETEPGRILGEVRLWDPEDPVGQNTDLRDEELALSAAAINTTVVKDQSFKFAKTLTLPFFGSGMLDLRPGDKKKTKNSRKMQLVFFVHHGRVKVEINGDNIFRIGKGGMFQVPRGNPYSIENDYDQEARIFFAQGCEVDVEEEVTQQ
ncbi:Inner kinetochore subunit [Lachnellula suecica]|uniref:CENP-C homolog n=1 Tax=Lachnellula suecica TaxID=602035 RepID=A0A8T9CB83_9HELO|nr:Inner kinetochore subunit [Lachnellula suecica]